MSTIQRYGWDGFSLDNGKVVLYTDHLADKQAAMEAARAAEWQDIATAPKDGTRFLAPHPESGHVDFFHWQGPDRSHIVGWRDSFIGVYREGTGPKVWMPLPTPPAPTTPEPRS